MDELPNYWEGAAYDNARSTYEEEYQTLLTTTVPEAVGNFRDYINQCMEKIIEKETGIPTIKPADPFLVTPTGIAMNCKV